MLATFIRSLKHTFVGTTVQFSCEYSAWTGLVTWAQVSKDRQDIKVGLNFGETESVFWTSCPAFIDGDCFGENALEEDDLILDRVSLPADHEALLHFSMRDISRWQSTDSVIGRDVAGLVGAGPEAPLFRNKNVKLTHTTQNLVNVWECDAIDESLSNYVAILSPRNWRIPVHIFPYGDEEGNRGKHRIELLFDPIIQEIEIPWYFWRRTTSDFLRNEVGKDIQIDTTTGRLIIPCRVAHVLNFQMSMWDGNEDFLISIPRSLLIVNEGLASEDMCPLRIKLTDHEHLAKIGRLMLLSLESVILDYKNKRMGFISKWKTEFPGVPLFRFPRIPSFQYPVVEEDKIVLKRVQREGWNVPGDQELLLDNFLPTRDGQRIKCWRLHRFLKLNVAEGNLNIHGTFSGVSLDLIHGDLVFNLGRDGAVRNVKVSISLGASTVDVCAVRNTDITSVPILPPPEILDETHADLITEECAICLIEMNLGDEIQGLHECFHKFHKNCVIEWVEGYGGSCPKCRTEPARKDLKL